MQWKVVASSQTPSILHGLLLGADSFWSPALQMAMNSHSIVWNG